MEVRGELTSDGSMQDHVEWLDGGSVHPRRHVVFGESSTFAKKESDYMHIKGVQKGRFFALQFITCADGAVLGV